MEQERRKLIVKIAYGLIAVLVLVLVVLTIYQQRLIRQMDSTQEASPLAEDKAIVDTGAQKQGVARIESEAKLPAADTSASELDTLKYQLESSEEELDLAREDLSNEIEKQAEAARNQIDLTKKMLQNPTAKKMLRSNIKSAFDSQYRDLFVALGLSEEKQEAFKELLAEQQMQTLDIGMEMLDQSLTEEQKKENAAQLENLKTDFDNQAIDILGSNNFETYDTYRESLAERQYASSFSQSLGTDDGISEAQKQNLIDAMYDARKEVDAEYGSDNENVQTSFNEIETEKQIERLNLTFERYAASADGILTDSQTEKFQDQLDQQKEMLVMTIKMASQLYGASTAD